MRCSARALCALLVVLVAPAVAVAVDATPSAAAEQTLCHGAALARQRTEIDADMTVPRFDPAMGRLLEVSVPTQGLRLDTDAKFENTAASAVTFQEDMTYQVTFTSPAGLPSPPVVSGTVPRVPSQTLAAFDGTLDYTGPSAVTQPSTTRDANAAPVTSTDPAVRSAFTGPGTVAFHLATRIGEVFTGGGGNVEAQINTFGAGAVRVCYRFAPPPPPPTPPPRPIVVHASPPVVAPPRFTG